MKKTIFSLIMLFVAVGVFACGHSWVKPPLKEINGYCIHGNIKGEDAFGLDDIRVFESSSKKHIISIYCDSWVDEGGVNILQTFVDNFTNYNSLLKDLDKYDVEWYEADCCIIPTDCYFKPYKKGTRPVPKEEHFGWMD